MDISREDVDRRQVDFSGVSLGKRLDPVHPGEILRDEFLRPMALDIDRLARALKVQRPLLNDIARGRRAVDSDLARRLGRYFGMSPEFWINLQVRHDLDVAKPAVQGRSNT